MIAKTHYKMPVTGSFDATVAKRYLRNTGIRVLRHQAAFIPSRTNAPLPAPVPPEKPVCSAAAIALLEDILENDLDIMLPEWLKTVYEQGYHVPPEYTLPLMKRFDGDAWAIFHALLFHCSRPLAKKAIHAMKSGKNVFSMHISYELRRYLRTPAALTPPAHTRLIEHLKYYAEPLPPWTYCMEVFQQCMWILQQSGIDDFRGTYLMPMVYVCVMPLAFYEKALAIIETMQNSPKLHYLEAETWRQVSDEMYRIVQFRLVMYATICGEDVVAI